MQRDEDARIAAATRARHNGDAHAPDANPPSGDGDDEPAARSAPRDEPVPTEE
jgi:hypothetical protein